MKHALMLAVVLLFLLVACSKDGRKKKPDASLRLLRQTVNNTGLSLGTRLNAARAIDSVTSEQAPANIRLGNQLDIGLLYLKMDSMTLARPYLNEAIRLARVTGAEKELAVAHNSMAIVFNAQSAYDSALIHYEITYQLFSRQHDTLKAAQALVNIGISYKNKGDWETAFRKTLAAATVLRSVNANRELAYCYTTMGNVLRELKRYDESFGYHQQALQIRRTQKDSAGIAVCLNNIGNIYRDQHQPDIALVYYRQSYAIKKKDGKPQTIATALDNIAEASLELGKTAEAEAYFKQALHIRIIIHDREGYLSTTNRLANLYLSVHQLNHVRDMAIATARELPDSGFLQQRLEHTLVLLQLAMRERDYKGATDYAKQALALKDKVFSDNLSEAVTRMNTEFQTAEKQKALEASRRLEEAGRKQISLQRDFILSLTLLIGLLLVVIYLLYRSNKLRKAANKRIALLKSELEHSVDNKLQRLSMLLLQQMNTTQQPGETAILKGVRAKVQAMIIVHTTLYKDDNYQGQVNAPDIVRPLLQNLPLVFEKNEGAVTIHSQLEDYEIPASDALTLGLIVNELLTNIYKHNPDFEADAYINVELISGPEDFIIAVSDNGKPWEAKPDQEKGKGLQLIEMLAAQLGGQYSTSRQGSENKSQIHLASKKTT